ncbi:CHAD domain-containing protein [Asanoa ishikariensis]|uniref:CHAD domain-containing protein n=1 Tax=Asanoa ishikariensis TaxID=137265 RepID=A0A1H3R674_9ACTN|nr:CYTH and CHAD domain-containing protein [Asanoa ishikariensis]GIF64359.1 CHAD domain-containing protein [Asanoa ishikariensis]SDZ21332.1 CHAD domain-containing protein [Asanoa ishikariensis]
MRTVVERERKFESPDGFRMPDLSHDGIAALDEPALFKLDATYYDTPELRLTRGALALRRRTGGADAGWHLKVGAAGGARTEHQRALTKSTSPPRDLMGLVQAATRGATVEPVARIETRRREWRLLGADGAVLATLADDAVVGHDLVDDRRVAWHEIEVELVEGDEDLLDAVERRLRRAGARPGSPAKIHRVLGERLDVLTAIDAGAATPVLAYAAAHRDDLVAHEPAARAGDVDGVHDMRVAVRRLRSTFRSFRELWDAGRVDGVRAELKWLGEQLGGVRDAQVMGPRLAKAVRREPAELVLGPVAADLSERFAADEAAALLALRRALTSRRYATLLSTLDELVETPPAMRVSPRWVNRRIHKAVRRADSLLDTALERQAERDTGDDDPALHEARKAYKRGRYAVEVRKLAGDKNARKLVRGLRGLQDLLGDHQDSVITRQVLRETAVQAFGRKANTFTYGLLYAEQVAHGRALVRALPAAQAKSRRRKLRRWLR